MSLAEHAESHLCNCQRVGGLAHLVEAGELHVDHEVVDSVDLRLRADELLDTKPLDPNVHDEVHPLKQSLDIRAPIRHIVPALENLAMKPRDIGIRDRTSALVDLVKSLVLSTARQRLRSLLAQLVRSRSDHDFALIILNALVVRLVRPIPELSDGRLLAWMPLDPVTHRTDEEAKRPAVDMVERLASAHDRNVESERSQKPVDRGFVGRPPARSREAQARIHRSLDREILHVSHLRRRYDGAGLPVNTTEGVGDVSPVPSVAISSRCPVSCLMRRKREC